MGFRILRLIEIEVLEKINSFPAKEAERFKEKLKLLKQNPFPSFDSDKKEIKGTRRTAYRLRVGDYRFFYAIDIENKVVKVTEFLTAEQAHKKYGRL